MLTRQSSSPLGQLTEPPSSGARRVYTLSLRLVGYGLGDLLHTLEGHTDRLGRIAFHPMGQHLATASFDTTWRLWDLEAGTCLMEQEGHSRSVYTISFQTDGSLIASGGLDAIGESFFVQTEDKRMLH